MQHVDSLGERICDPLGPVLFGAKMDPKRTGPNGSCYKLFSKSNNFFKLSAKFKISLAKIDAINPLIPNTGTKKKIKLILTNKSIILIKRTLT